MSAPGIVIASAGVVTPVGLSLAETAASARARVARIREIEWRDRRFEPFVVGSVPDDGLPELAAGLNELPLQYREGRMLRLAHVALEEALAPLAGKAGPIPLLLGLPEQHTTMPLQPREFLAHLAVQVPGALDIERSLAVPRGRAGGLMALREAAARLVRGDSPFVLVGGVDCLVDLYVLGALDVQGRIRNDVNSDGFSPSEGAAFLLLSLASTAQAHGLKPLASVLGSAQGYEPGHLYSEERYLGEGLAATFASLLAEAPPPQPIGSVYSSFNGERYWAREYGVARLRHTDSFAAEHTMEHPAECFGDMGSAQGPALAALAAHGVQQGYRRAPCLVFASSDRGDRAASLLGRVA
ncbi:MAG: beta-ketoacyl synthase N-terminal-like domain-containing protein [Burkholderiaceae bacterium]